jgi:hypothetical protein
MLIGRGEEHAVKLKRRECSLRLSLDPVTYQGTPGRQWGADSVTRGPKVVY